MMFGSAFHEITYELSCPICGAQFVWQGIAAHSPFFGWLLPAEPTCPACRPSSDATTWHA